MAYNKLKHVEAAHKYLAQNKLPQAILEYQNILKHEPNDQATLMTVGDLFVRKGETFQAIEYFERLAQGFTRDGFLTKSIAIYKKIAKLAPEETKPLEKLAELYVQQGVLSEARPIYLQLAEAHVRAGRTEPAAALLRKLLEAEPDNLRVQMRLADIQQAMGQHKDAAQTLLHCAERLLGRNEAAEAAKLADRVLALSPEHPGVKIVKARALAATNKRSEAIALLEAMPEVESNEELTGFLLDQYFREGQTGRAKEFAQRIFTSDQKRFKPAQQVVVTLLESDQPDSALELLDPMRQAMILHGEQEELAKLLTASAAQLPGRLEPFEWLVELYSQVNDSFRLPQAMAQLGQAAAASGNLERARDVYEQLFSRVPHDETVRQNLNQVRALLGLDPVDAAPSRPPQVLPQQEEPAAAKPAIQEVALDDETLRYVTLSLTDVDLFSSYGLTQKAIDLLEKVIKRVPQHTGALEKLLDLHLGEGHSQQTVELAARLSRIHRERGDAAQAERFHELERRFQRASSAEPQPPPPMEIPAEFALPEADLSLEASQTESPATAKSEAEAQTELIEVAEESASAIELGEGPTEEEIHEIDISDEWSAISDQVQQSFDTKPAEAHEPATAGVETNSTPFVMESEPAAHRGTNGTSAPVTGVPETPEMVETGGIPERGFGFRADTPASAPTGPGVIAMPSPKQNAPAAKREETPEVAAPDEYELELVDASPKGASAATLPSAEGPLGNLAAEFEDVLGSVAPVMAGNGSSAHPAPRGKATPADSIQTIANTPLQGASDPGGPLSEVFNEFREALDELQTEEDPETHYNLGVAYREMGLLEEAISEFQKVAQAHDRGKVFRYAMQCCTLLGLAFMEKGQPEIAAFWYERSLQTPGLDLESILALKYDLGVAQELAGQTEGALKSFQQVYAMNIDYRDVGERIAVLRKR
ncbi:MAG TPA: tetratricopeptide repeat protein [Candidatus Acidoferrales bacterium]|nr:tetratricopeptide repeat protein [Candidatus Acidoferrales bacterium]